jgi:hypothetical protein
MWMEQQERSMTIGIAFQVLWQAETSDPNPESRKEVMTSTQEVIERRQAPLNTPSDIHTESVREISGALNILLADVFALYIKTKNFH